MKSRNEVIKEICESKRLIAGSYVVSPSEFAAHLKMVWELGRQEATREIEAMQKVI